LFSKNEEEISNRHHRLVNPAMLSSLVRFVPRVHTSLIRAYSLTLAPASWQPAISLIRFAAMPAIFILPFRGSKEEFATLQE
jgi:hypothetical protein